jgi:hypothetical protein
MNKLMKNKKLITKGSEIEAMLLQRGKDTIAVGLRDLRRYYSLLNHHILELCLTTNEANLICEALKDYRLEEDPNQASGIWKQINTAIQRDQLDRKWSVNSAFISKIKAINHLQAVALIDSVERYWVKERSNFSHKSAETKLSHIGLIKCCDSAL